MTTHQPVDSVPGSFRDPAGFVFVRDGQHLRQVNRPYADTYEHLMRSGLYEDLVGANLMLAHHEDADAATVGQNAHKVLRPDQLAFTSYPYEWAFDQLRDAALAMLEIQHRALNAGMSLKDASAYNMQLYEARPRLIDTLSFELLDERYPWVAYRQFCEHFLAPLALMAYVDVRLGSLLRSHLNGIPLPLAARLMPFRTRLRPGLAIHLHLHARAQRRAESRLADRASFRGRMNLRRLHAVVGSLQSTVGKLRWDPQATRWVGYAESSGYLRASAAHKARLVSEFLDVRKPGTVWDLGANTGEYTRLAAARGAVVIAIDSDSGAVQRNYAQVVANHETMHFPIVGDLTNPSPGIGWENAERASLLDRGPADTVLALALLHHLAISNNLPLDRIAAFLANRGTSLIIEFVPPEDPRVRKLLAMRDHNFPDYHQDGFERAFGRHFSIDRRAHIEHSQRVLYLMTRR